MAATNVRGGQIKDADVSLTVDVTGTLPVGNGGTGAAGTLTGLVVGNGASAMTTVTAPAGAVVGTTDTQTETNKTLSDTYMGEVFDASKIQRDTTLLTSQDFISVETIEIPSAYSLEIPSASSLEVLTYQRLSNALVNNVKDSGAKGDGSTDDTAAIYRALAAGGITFFPAGVYIHTGITLPTSGAYLLGVGCGYYANSAPLAQRSVLKLKNSANVDSVKIFPNTSYITLENLEIDGNGANQSSNGIGINFMDNPVTLEDDSRLINVEVHNTLLQGIYYGASRRALFANRVIVSACGSHGIQCKGSDTTWIKTITGNHSTNAKPLYIGSVGNRFYGGDAFGASNTQNIYFNGIGCSIVGFSIDHADNEGVFVDSGADELQVIGCQFHTNSNSSNNGAPDIDISNATGATGLCFVGNDFGAIDGVPTNKRSYAIKCGTVTATAVGNTHNSTATATAYTDAPANLGDSAVGALTNKILADTYMGEVFDAQKIQRDATLLASCDFTALDVLEVASATSLEIPSSTSLEVLTYPPKRAIGRSVAPGASITINTDLYEQYLLSSLGAAITVTLSGMGRKAIVGFKDDGTARAITWANAVSSGVATLLSTTVIGKTHWVGLQHDGTQWVCLAVDAAGY